VTTRAEELSRLWEWSENIREEVGALSDAIAKLATKDLPDESDEEARKGRGIRGHFNTERCISGRE